MSLDPADRDLLLRVLDLTREARDAALQTRAEVIRLSDIIAREVGPLGGLRADLVERFEEQYRRTGNVVLRLNTLEQRVGDLEGQRAQNGGE